MRCLQSLQPLLTISHFLYWGLSVVFQKLLDQASQAVTTEGMRLARPVFVKAESSNAAPTTYSSSLTLEVPPGCTRSVLQFLVPSSDSSSGEAVTDLVPLGLLSLELSATDPVDPSAPQQQVVELEIALLLSGEIHVSASSKGGNIKVTGNLRISNSG